MAEENVSLISQIKSNLKGNSKLEALLNCFIQSHVTENGSPIESIKKLKEQMVLLNESKVEYQCFSLLINIYKHLSLAGLVLPSKNYKPDPKYIKFIDFINQKMCNQELEELDSIKLSSLEVEDYEKWTLTFVVCYLEKLLRDLCEIYGIKHNIQCTRFYENPFENVNCINSTRINSLQQTADLIWKHIEFVNNQILSNEVILKQLKDLNICTRLKLKSEIFQIVTSTIPAIVNLLSKNDNFYKNLLLHVEHLETKVEYLELKMELTKQDLLLKTYDENNRKALINIKNQLERKLYVAKNKLTHYQRSLDTYNNLGNDFKVICDKYAALQKQYDNKKWALTTL